MRWAVPHQTLLWRGILSVSLKLHSSCSFSNTSIRCPDDWICCKLKNWDNKKLIQMTNLDHESLDSCSYIQGTIQHTVVRQWWIILPDSCHHFHSCDLGDMGHPMFPARPPSSPFVHLPSSSRLCKGLPNDSPVCLLLCTILYILHNVDECVADRRSYHQCGMPFAFWNTSQIQYHSYQNLVSILKFS